MTGGVPPAVLGGRGSGGGDGSASAALQRLADRHHVETSYTDAFGERRVVSDESLLAVLQALGEPISNPTDAQSILDGEASQGAAASPRLPAVVVAWDGELPAVEIAPGEARAGLRVALALEDGADAGELVGLEVRHSSTVIVAAEALPFGIHQLAVSTPAGPGTRSSRGGGEPDEITIISAPSRSRPPGPRAWGLFSPTYALWDEPGSDSGDLGSLGRFGTFAARVGASYVSTLPLLAGFSRVEEPDGLPSPYSPISRMWWHEGYLDPLRVPELADLFTAERHARPSQAGGAAGSLCDPSRRSAELLPLLGQAARRLEVAGGNRLAKYQSYLAERPDVLSYGRFRAACERAGIDWRHWPASWRNGLLDERALDPETIAAHTYAQFVTDEQVGETARTIRSAGAEIMLDLPVGCRRDGFDPWAYPDSFANGASIGAPPDRFFSSGQNWGFPPLRPEGEREAGYEVTRGALRHLLRHAGALRLDHVPGVARLWWIPDGLSAAEGAYVSYPAEELMALCCLEAWRTKAALVGEDLGTVDPSLTTELNAHGIAGMHVAVFDLEGENAHPMEPLSPREGSVALVDTHDTATFAGWFSGRDIADRLALGLLAEKEATAERQQRKRAVRTLVDRLIASDLLERAACDDPAAVHEALALELAQSAAGLVMLNVEDCWGELDPQNIPGTTKEHANFCRPLEKSLSEIEQDGRLLTTSTRMRAVRPRAETAPRAGKSS